MRFLRSIIPIILFIGFTAGLTACGGGGGDPPPPETGAVWDESNWDEKNWL